MGLEFPVSTSFLIVLSECPVLKTTGSHISSLMLYLVQTDIKMWHECDKNKQELRMKPPAASFHVKSYETRGTVSAHRLWAKVLVSCHRCMSADMVPYYTVYCMHRWAGRIHTCTFRYSCDCCWVTAAPSSFTFHSNKLDSFCRRPSTLVHSASNENAQQLTSISSLNFKTVQRRNENDRSNVC